MKPLLLKTAGVQSQVEEISGIASQMDTLSEQVRTISNSVTNKISSSSKIREQLNQILEDMEEHQTVMMKLSDVLSQSIQTYVKSEGMIVDKYKKEEVSFGSKGQAGAIEGKDSEGQILDLINEIFDINGNPSVGVLKTMLISIKDAKMWKALELISQGKRFRIVTENGRKFIKLRGGDNLTKQQVKEFMEAITGKEGWTKYDAKILRQKGIELYNKKNPNHTYERLFKDGRYNELANYLDDFQLGNGAKMAKAFGTELKDSMKFWDDFKPSNYSDLGKASKFAKGLSAVGTALDIASDFSDDFFENGKFTMSGENVKEFVVDTTVSVTANAGVTAAGAAIGSLFAPPIGTVVGAGAGAAIGYVTNTDVYDFDGDGKKDSLIDGAKYGANCAVDYVGDKVGDVVDGIGNFFGSIF
ncbi:hypothetical protein [Anaerosporobacter sp.]